MSEAAINRRQLAYNNSAVAAVYSHKADTTFSISSEVFDAARKGGVMGGVRRLYKHFSEARQQKPLQAAFNTARTLLGSEIITLHTGIDQGVAQILTQKEGLVGNFDETALRRRNRVSDALSRAVSTLFYTEHSDSDGDMHSGISGRSTTNSWGQKSQTNYYYRPSDSDISQAEWDS